MKVLVIGSGGREHALCHALARSPQVEKLYCAPGNPGIARTAETSSPSGEEIPRYVEDEGIDLVVIGPEAPLVDGLADRLRAANRKVFGPSAAAARLEGSKVFAKEFMHRHGIPTASFSVARSVPEAQEAARRFGDGVVIKADGLAAGKGVVVCGGLEEAEAAIDRIMARSEFGAAGDRVVVERRLSGTELSLIAVSDGERYRLMIPAQDHKQLGDGDRGPNTGGMGAYAPAPRIAPPELVGRVEREVIQRTLQGMRDEGFPLTGVLYAGLMIDQEGRPQVLEFNVRFGDPETQPQMMMLGSDLAELMVASDGGDVSRVEVEWREGAAVTVVAAAQGYPSSPRKGDPIEGIEEAERGDDRIVFHAGTALVDGRLVVAGGRVLGVTARAADLASARAAAYEMMEAIGFRGMHYRTDIAEKGL